MNAPNNTIIHGLLNEQYQTVEAFANAQSRLFNATIDGVDSSSSSSSSQSSSAGRNNTNNKNMEEEVSNAISNLLICRDNIRSNTIQLQNEISSNNNNCHQHYVMLIMEQHMSLSRRVIETIANNPSWYSNGIPTMHPTNTSLETNTIALASLKASIANVLELL